MDLLLDGTRYLVLSGGEKHDSIYNRIRYLIGVKSGITHGFVIIIQESSLPLGTPTFRDINTH